MAAAAHRHALPKGNFGGHAEGEFDFSALGKRSVGEKEDAARTEILGEADALNRSARLTKGHRKKVGEALSDTAFNCDWRSGHDGVTSFAGSSKVQALL